MKVNKIFTIAILTIGVTISANAQVTGTTENVSASISASVNAVVSGTPTLAAFTTQTQLEQGVISNQVSFEVSSNKLWSVTTSITDIAFTSTGDSPGTPLAPMTPANIAWGTENGTTTNSSFTTFVSTTSTTSAALEIKTGAMGDESISGNTFNLQYKVTPGYLIDPGSYAIAVTHTITPI